MNNLGGEIASSLSHSMLETPKDVAASKKFTAYEALKELSAAISFELSLD
jgi:hypothetical protein